jgi:hypothetical protein
MSDATLLVSLAREVIDGLATTRDGMLDSFKPVDRGTCVVERCAQFIEAACGKCQASSCARCSIAAELRGAQTSINDARDAEIRELGLDDQDMEGIVHSMVNALCVEHAHFGTVLLEQWRAQN